MQTIRRPDHILFGGDYNPDQWDEETLIQDMRYFHKANINTVTLPVFTWAKMEPEDGVYCFEWLDHILDILDDNRISYFLSTPTAAQPAWMSRKYPEILPVDIQGRRRTHGMRVFFCVNSPVYRRKAAAIAAQMAQRYHDRPGLIGWHVANEYGTYCYCPICERRFRTWLAVRYGTIENLNDRWNTSFWGRTVYDWDEIMLPTELNDDFRFCPAVELDYRRFVTDSTTECFENEARILKQANPDLPVFTNISGNIQHLDQFRMVPHMDVAAWDNYPAPKDPPSLPAMKHDMMRTAMDGASYLVMEQSPNQQNWQPYNKLKRPGEIRRLCYQGLAHGADSSLYFQMRQSVGGQEKFHGAVISHSGRTDTRIFREITALGAELKKLGGVLPGGMIEAKVGIYFDWENWWALSLASGPSKDIDYLSEVHHYYHAFYEEKIPVDIIKTDTDLSKYRLIVAPMLYMLRKDTAKRIEAFVKNGGTLIATYLTGLVDENDRCVYGAYPGLLREVLGLWVEETDALYPDEQNHLRFLNQRKASGSLTFLCDLIHLDGARALAVYEDDFYAGLPAITVHDFGCGKAYYLASRPDEKTLLDFVREILKETGITPVLPSSGPLEITKRENQNGSFYFLINQGDTSGTVDLKDGSYKDLLHDTVLTGLVRIDAGDVMILQEVPTSC